MSVWFHDIYQGPNPVNHPGCDGLFASPVLVSSATGTPWWVFSLLDLTGDTLYDLQRITFDFKGLKDGARTAKLKLDIGTKTNSWAPFAAAWVQDYNVLPPAFVDAVPPVG